MNRVFLRLCYRPDEAWIPDLDLTDGDSEFSQLSQQGKEESVRAAVCTGRSCLPDSHSTPQSAVMPSYLASGCSPKTGESAPDSPAAVPSRWCTAAGLPASSRPRGRSVNGVAQQQLLHLCRSQQQLYIGCRLITPLALQVHRAGCGRTLPRSTRRPCRRRLREAGWPLAAASSDCLRF